MSDDADREEVLAIERAAFEAWPASEVLAQGGWRLRFTEGVTNRGNSLWAGPPDACAGAAATPLAERIAWAEQFYAERGQPALFHLSPASEPAELDAALAARGYREHSPVLVQTAEASEVLAAVAEPGDTLCSLAPSEDWFELSGRRGRFEGAASLAYRGILRRIEGRAGFALARWRGEPAAVGLCAVLAPRACISSMLTLAPFRSRGLGAQVLRALAEFALSRGAPQIFLQVEEENVDAQRLYARSGFRTRYRTHYRRRF